MKALVVIAILAAGCAGDFAGGDDDSCAVTLSYTPVQPLAGPDSEVRVTSDVTGAASCNTAGA
jgi:hypothetical protein